MPTDTLRLDYHQIDGITGTNLSKPLLTENIIYKKLNKPFLSWIKNAIFISVLEYNFLFTYHCYFKIKFFSIRLWLEQLNLLQQ